MSRKPRPRHYDLAFGIGFACACSQSLRHAGLQHLSFPGDWLTQQAPFTRPSLVTRVDFLCHGLDHFFDLADLKFAAHCANGKDAYLNTRTRYVFNHDFPRDCTLERELPKVIEKYTRRRDRLLGLIRKSSKVLVLRLDLPDGSMPTAPADATYALNKLEQTFPGVTFDLLLVQPGPGVRLADTQPEQLSPHLFRLVFDYRDQGPDAVPNIPDIAIAAAAVGAFARVRDYRTGQERRAHRRSKQLKRWARFGATTRWGYYLARLRQLLRGRR